MQPEQRDVTALPLERLREMERLFESKNECSPAVNKAGRELLRAYQGAEVEIERLGSVKWGDISSLITVAAERDRLRAAIRHVVADSPGTPDSVRRYLIRELEGSWGEPYEEAMLRG